MKQEYCERAIISHVNNRQNNISASRPMSGSTGFSRFNTNEIMSTDYPPIRWIVPDYLPEGFSVLAGRQKLGKTWLAIDWILSVASGGLAMGVIECEQGDCLYIDMENGSRRIQRRINALFPDENLRPDFSKLEWVFDAPQLNCGFIPKLEDWRCSVENPRLVVIDVLQRIKPAGSGARNAYENDYSIFSELQRWSIDNGIAVLGLHHTKKGGADDPVEAVSGSNGLSAVADATLVLDRNSKGTTLYVRGRDVEEKETAVSFEAGKWSLEGEASEVHRSQERKCVLDELLAANRPLGPKELAAKLGKSSGTIGKMLHLMANAGEVRKISRGEYVHLEYNQLPLGKDGKEVINIETNIRS